jgi:hypothetical protein
MGLSENPTDPPQNQAGTQRKPRKRPARRPRRRRCLLKGCENGYRPQRALQRYCSAECREAARAWSRWKAQQRYRATAPGQEKRRAQSRRYRKRLRIRQEQVEQAAEAAARVITRDFFSGLLRPARLLRGIHAQPPIPGATLLLERVPARSRARLRAGAALAGGAARIPTGGPTSLPAKSPRR